MRLIDQVVNASPQVAMVDRAGKTHRLAGVGSKADAIRRCELRFILDDIASLECMNLVTGSNDGLLDPRNDLLRLPATQFWVEWLGMRQFGDLPRVGALVKSSLDGLRGCVTGYWQDEHGRAVTMGMSVGFDLAERRRKDASLVTFRHGSYEHLNPLFECAYLDIDPCWATYLCSQQTRPFKEIVQAFANGSWYYLPFVFAFAAMLNSKDVVDQRPSDLSRLNSARLRRGREALLDHIEVRMKLGRSGAAVTRSPVASTRCTPRLHHVRGHFVRRDGKTFWRSSHLRGDAGRPVHFKTVLVSADRQSAA